VAARETLCDWNRILLEVIRFLLAYAHLFPFRVFNFDVAVKTFTKRVLRCVAASSAAANDVRQVHPVKDA
jgi:hypothetical protein